MPKHGDGFAEQWRQLARAEHHRAELLRHKQMRGRDVAGQLEQELLLYHLVAGEHLGFPDIGRCQDKIALVKRGIAGVYHHAHALVSRVAVRQREFVGVPAHIDDMQVAAAYGREGCFDERVSGFQRGYGDFVAAELTQAGGDGGGHCGHGRCAFRGRMGVDG